MTCASLVTTLRVSRTRWCRRSPGPAALTLHDHLPGRDDRRGAGPGRQGVWRLSTASTAPRPTRPARTRCAAASARRPPTGRSSPAPSPSSPSSRYLTFRFEFKFAIPAIVALLHDVGLTLGIYAASNRLVTTATVAAILTILGYSVHDTIIVFDRMRENTLLMKKETYGEMVDLSIRQTMIRSINTTIALLLPLLAILIFGGPRSRTSPSRSPSACSPGPTRPSSWRRRWWCCGNRASPATASVWLWPARRRQRRRRGRWPADAPARVGSAKPTSKAAAKKPATSAKPKPKPGRCFAQVQEG